MKKHSEVNQQIKLNLMMNLNIVAVSLHVIDFPTKRLKLKFWPFY